MLLHLQNEASNDTHILGLLKGKEELKPTRRFAQGKAHSINSGIKLTVVN